MATEHKLAERGRNKKEEIMAKANGKHKIKSDDASEKVPIARFSSSNSLNHESNEAKSTQKSSEEERMEFSGEVIVVDDSVQVSPAADGIDVSRNKKKKKKEDTSKKKIKDEIEENDSSLLYQIPMNRVSRIVKSEDPNVRITQEAVYIINKATEKFLQVFSTEAYASAFLDRKKHIDYKLLSSIVSKRRRFDFLSDFVPEKLKAEDALKESPIVEN